MSLFVDTSALFAILDADDLNHAAAKETWTRLLTSNEQLVSTSYVLIETLALVQRRLGMDAVKALHQDILPVLEIEWITAAQHASAIEKLIAASRRDLSLVDWVSFITMQRLKIRTAFAFDEDFEKHGFDCIPVSN